ncbi:hypothetical protein IHE45_03G077500 [Dioscorea alata]|uniref:Uncharacterized protein n=1 Tax=Dioscorea alata TaxID=55571 RepID=A0ACB7WLX3_DIOAL|nr:hypothetical protein IHE45_03G077500 [Dioscorea alata]
MVIWRMDPNSGDHGTRLIVHRPCGPSRIIGSISSAVRASFSLWNEITNILIPNGEIFRPPNTACRCFWLVCPEMTRMIEVFFSSFIDFSISSVIGMERLVLGVIAGSVCQI